MIKVENLTKIYDAGSENELTALDHASFEIKAGEFVSITGRSGSGKSTLLYQLGLLDIPSEGKVFIEGFDTSKLDQPSRTKFRLTEFGYVFQDYATIPSLTALENVMVPLLMSGMSFAEARKKSTKVLDQMGLGNKLDNLPSQLSGGQQQRVSIARAIGHDPKILFADEPTANLDSETSKVVLDVFLELHQAGQTIVMVTHEDEYSALTDRIIELSDGVIVSDEKNRYNSKVKK